MLPQKRTVTVKVLGMRGDLHPVPTPHQKKKKRIEINLRQKLPHNQNGNASRDKQDHQNYQDHRNFVLLPNSLLRHIFSLAFLS